MAEIVKQIKELKEEKDVLILAHYYVNEEVQKIADCVGDSYYLSEKAVGAKEKVLLFCGVSFMGESAKILNPDKLVLMPDAEADCPMAHMAAAEKIRKVREEYEDLAVVCYINSTAELKRCAPTRSTLTFCRTRKSWRPSDSLRRCCSRWRANSRCGAFSWRTVWTAAKPSACGLQLRSGFLLSRRSARSGLCRPRLHGSKALRYCPEKRLNSGKKYDKLLV